MVPAGNYSAKAVSGEFATSSKKGTEYVSVQFQIVGGQHDGQSVYWNGYFGEKSSKRTFESLKFCGCTFPGDDATNLDGLTTNTVPVVVEHDTYVNDSGEQKTRASVSWVNNPAGAIAPEQQMDAAKKAAFRAKMLGTVASLRTGNGTATVQTGKAPF